MNTTLSTYTGPARFPSLQTVPMRHVHMLLATTLMIATAELAGRASELQEFIIQPERSQLTLSGQLWSSPQWPWEEQTAPFIEQGPGSATTTLTGTIGVEASGGAIRMRPIGVVEVRTNGTWWPEWLGTVGWAPANCAVRADGYPVGLVGGALRDLLLSFESGALPLQAGLFDARGVAIRVPGEPSARFDLSIGEGGPPLPLYSILVGNSWANQASAGSLATNGLIQTLTLPVNFSSNCYFGFIGSAALDFQYRLSGQVVAVRTNEPPLRLLSIARTNNFVSLSWQSRAGSWYRVLSSTNLVTWQTNAAITATSPITSFTTPSGQARQFFRIAR